jgi:hypothetical protein
MWGSVKCSHIDAILSGELMLSISDQTAWPAK